MSTLTEIAHLLRENRQLTEHNIRLSDMIRRMQAVLGEGSSSTTERLYEEARQLIGRRKAAPEEGSE